MTVRVLSPRATLACYLMLLLAYLAGAVVPPLDGVSAGYADIALGIIEEGKWTQFMTQGQDYQGGPPLLFWLVALSFELFGVNVVAVKLPSLLFSVLAVYSTVRLGKLLYNNDTVARLAGVILASSFAFLFVNNTADMDALLIGSVAFATCQLFIFVTDENKLSARAHLVVAGAGLALGLASRGLIGVVLPLVAVFLYLVYRLEWRRIFDPFWLALPLFVLLFASPLFYAYHVQFGMDGPTNFVLWLQGAEQQVAKNSGEVWDLFFYYYIYLLAFLPWSAIALWSLASGALRLTNDRYWPRAQGYAVTMGLIVGVFILLSLARFKLTYYVSALLPFFALLLAGWLPARLRHPLCHRKLWQTQYVVFALVADAILVFNVWMFPLPMWNWVIGAVAVALLVLGIWGIPRWFGGSRLVTVSVSMSAMFWLLANLNIYPGMLEYQAGTELGALMMERYPEKVKNVYYLEGEGWAASFNLAVRRRVKTLTLNELEDRVTSQGKETVLFITGMGWEDKIGAKGLSYVPLEHRPLYDISQPEREFLDPNMRDSKENKGRRAAVLLCFGSSQGAGCISQERQ